MMMDRVMDRIYWQPYGASRPTSPLFSLVVVYFSFPLEAVEGLNQRLWNQSAWIPVLASLPTAYTTLETLLNICKMGVTITPTFEGCGEE